MAVKYLAGNRLWGTDAERLAMTTGGNDGWTEMDDTYIDPDFPAHQGRRGRPHDDGRQTLRRLQGRGRRRALGVAVAT